MKKVKLSPVLLFILLFIGCGVTKTKNPLPKQHPHEWPQRCEMCGVEWLVTPINSNKTIPPTVEWCFYDGSYCNVGLDMIIQQNKNGESLELERQWISHCKSCKGCRCAAFQPNEWRKITNGN